jgi:hypothetical protein
LVLQFGDTEKLNSDGDEIVIIDETDVLEDNLAFVSPTRKDGYQLLVTARWDLDRVILNPDMLRSVRQIPLLRNAERALVDRTRQLYVTRRRLVAELMTPSGKQTVRERINAELRLREVEAQLTALTNEDLFAASTSPESR